MRSNIVETTSGTFFIRYGEVFILVVTQRELAWKKMDFTEIGEPVPPLMAVRPKEPEYVSLMGQGFPQP